MSHPFFRGPGSQSARPLPPLPHRPFLLSSPQARTELTTHLRISNFRATFCACQSRRRCSAALSTVRGSPRIRARPCSRRTGSTSWASLSIRMHACTRRRRFKRCAVAKPVSLLHRVAPPCRTFLPLRPPPPPPPPPPSVCSPLLRAAGHLLDRHYELDRPRAEDPSF